MAPADKDNEKNPRGGSAWFKLSILFLFLNMSSLAGLATGFMLKACRISNLNAICAKSKLSAVPQDVPSTVKGFDLSVNKISRIQASDFRNVPHLAQLELNRNTISQIDQGAFVNLRELQNLNLNNNKLRRLEDNIFDGLSNLTELRITSNRIQTVASTTFKSLTSLKFLDLSFNSLRYMTTLQSILQQLPHLQYLAVKKINLETFQSWEPTNTSIKLAYLDLSQNKIAVFRITEDILPNLTWLNIGGTPQKYKISWDVNGTMLSRVATLDIGGLQVGFDNIKTVLASFNFSLTRLRMSAMKNNLAALINISCTIPTLSGLQVRRNKISSVRSDLFRPCVNITELDLAENHVRSIHDQAFRSIADLRILSLSRNQLTCAPGVLRSLPTLAELDLSTNNISALGCEDFANLTRLRKLSLYENSISVLNQCVFKDLTGLQTLKLQKNQISKLNHAFQKYLPNLSALRLDGNKLVAIKGGEFAGLRSLQKLSVFENHINKLDNGSFLGLTKLTEVLLQSNMLTKTDINTGVFNDLISLRRLDMRNNRIKYYNSSAMLDPPFSRLSQLEVLAFPAQHSRGKSQLPRNFLQGLANLRQLDFRNIQLLSLHGDTFNHTPQLHTLDISSNDLTDLSPRLFAPLRDLRSLYISRTSLLSLEFLIKANLSRLEYLQARKNQFSVIREEVMDSLPALEYVDFQGNSFTCDCDNAWFLQWVVNSTQVQVFDADNFVCNYPPDLKGMELLKLDTRSCSVDIEFICFTVTSCSIVTLMLVSFTYHFLRWQLVYAYHLFLAFLFERRHKNRNAPGQYDAFISYNRHDEAWVVREMLPKLEGEQGWKLCLHHRDFEPGKPIIENLTDAIYGSRKTICVISQRYLESEWCSREIQAASFRLFDEQKDVLILVFLEDIPIYHLSPYYRMRKLLKKKTYLSWPRAHGHTELFWEKLRQALRTPDDLGGDRLLLTVVARN